MRRHLIKAFVVVAIAVLCPSRVNAQTVSMATNVIDYMRLGTVNLELSVATGQKVSLTLDGRYNNWGFGQGTPESPWFQDKRLALSAGMRYWFWNIYSGWWLSGKFRYQEYNRGGMFRKPLTEEGDAYGMVLGIGYAWMLNSHLNLDFGVSAFGCRAVYRQYACPRCGMPVDGDFVKRKWMLSPYDAEVFASITFIL